LTLENATMGGGQRSAGEVGAVNSEAAPATGGRLILASYAPSASS
jgi:hypothetical protein